MKKIILIFIAWGLLNLIGYLFAFKHVYVMSWGLFGIISVCVIMLIISSIIVLLLIGVLSITPISNVYFLKKFPSLLLVTGFALVLLVLQVGISNQYTYIPGNLAVGEWLELDVNGTTQYISVRTEDESNPVILFLAGGPGGSQIQSTREHFDKLEAEFTIVNWEQPGSGRSFGARDIETITVDTYIKDGHAITEYLKDRFNQDKIYIIGESWGSYLAIELATNYPEDYHSIITTGQMVAFAETEVFCYEKALEVAREMGDEAQIEKLNSIEEVPVRGGNISLESASYLTYLHQYMNTIDDVKKTSWDTFDSLFSPEYSIMDSLNFMRALYYTFSHVYQQLYDTDLRQTHTTLEVPIYILHGRHDINAPSYLVDDYYERIEAPEKELIYFEHSGHNPMINESDQFQETVMQLLLQD